MGRHGWAPKEPPPGTEPLDLSKIESSIGHHPKSSPLSAAIHSSSVSTLAIIVRDMEDALCRIAMIHREEGFAVNLTSIATCQDIARRAVSHIPHYEIEERAAQHQRESAVKPGGSDEHRG